MMDSSTTMELREVERIAVGDYVILSGGGLRRMVQVLPNTRIRLGSSGSVQLDKLVGLRFGEIVRYDPKNRVFLATNEYPDLDITQISNDVDEARDNRHLVDDNTSQLLSNTEVATIRQERGVEEFLTTLVEKSATFHSKTAYAQEKYLRKKRKRYGTLYKVDRVTPEGLAEIHYPTINPSDVEPEEGRWLRLRADTMALMLHHGDVHSGSRVLVYDRTNGVLPAALLTRLGEDGLLLQLMDKSAQPNPFPAQAMGLRAVRERWKAVPRNAGFLRGEDETATALPEKEPQPPDDGEAEERCDEPKQERRRARREDGAVSQWLRGVEARAMLLERAADALFIVTDEDDEHEAALADLLPFLALCGHVVVYSPFLEDLTPLFSRLRGECVNICVMETWYRYHQVLPNRTHPTVNMSTAGGFLLTAVKVEPNANPRPRYELATSHGAKRPREEEKDTSASHSPRGEDEREKENREGLERDPQD